MNAEFVIYEKMATWGGFDVLVTSFLYSGFVGSKQLLSAVNKYWIPRKTSMKNVNYITTFGKELKMKINNRFQISLNVELSIYIYNI